MRTDAGPLEEARGVRDEVIVQRERSSPVGAIGWAMLAWVALFAVAAYAPGSGGMARRALLDIAQVVMPVAAAVLCWRASFPRHSPTARDRWAWRFFALGFLLSAAAEGSWAFYELALMRESPTPSIADMFYIAFYPAMLAGVLLLVRLPPSRFVRVTIMLDSLLFTLGLAGLAWQLILAPSVGAGDPALLVAVTVAYPMWDLVLIFALTTLFLSWRLERVALAPLFMLASFAVLVLADMLYAWLVLHGEYVTGSIADPLWPLSYALGGLAALSLIRSSPPPPEVRHAGSPDIGAASTEAWVDLHRSRVVRLVLPYLVFPVVIAILVIDFQQHAGDLDARGILMVGLAFLVLALVMVRQFLTLLENTRLNTSLGMLSRDLEQRVAELTQMTDELHARSSQLDTLNRVATTLSRSLEPEEVLATGLDLAREASGAMGGVIWVRDRDGRYSLAASRGLDLVEKEAFREYGRTGRALRTVFETQAPACALREESLGLPNESDSTWEVLALVPLVSRGEALGVLGLLVSDQPLHEEEGWLQLEESIAAQLGVALQNAQQYENALMLSERDPVTGLLNHRGFHDRLDQEIQRAQRSGGRVSLAMMDLDNFKLFNDTYGHPVGDDVLRLVAEHLSTALRASDIVGRYGGDEFAVILPEADAAGAFEIARRLRGYLHDHPFSSPDGLAVPVGISFGVATYPDDARSTVELVSIADANLYMSKGRLGPAATGAEIDVGEIRKKYGGAGIFGTLEGLVNAVDKKDHYTRRHSEDVTARAVSLARQLGLPEESEKVLHVAGLLHDVGKIGVPDAILQKPGRLDSDEFEVVKHHVRLSEMIIKEVPYLDEVIEAVGAHHERFDGTGYPRGLKGDEIPRLGRILAVADAYSAMTTDRPYRKAMSDDEARAELQRVSGTQLDPMLVRIFLSAMADEQAPSGERAEGAA